MSRRLFQNLLQVLMVLLLVTPTMAFPPTVVADGPTNLGVSMALVGGGPDGTTVAGTTVRFDFAVLNKAPDGAGTLGDAENVVTRLYLPGGFELVPAKTSPSNGDAPAGGGVRVRAGRYATGAA